MISVNTISDNSNLECCEDFSNAPNNPLQPLIDLDCDTCLNYVIKAEPFDINCTYGHMDFAYAGMISTTAISDCINETIQGCTVVKEFAKYQVNGEYPIDQALTSAYRFSASAFSGQEPNGEGRSSGGLITIDNADGSLDDILCLSWNGRNIDICAGDNCNWQYSEYLNIFNGTIKDITWNECDITLTIKDNSEQLNCNIQQNVYDSGDLLNKPKPLIFGEVNNITPVLVDGNSLLYQIHDGQVNSIIDVRDGGISLNFSGYDGDLTNHTPPFGEYSIDSANGLIKLGSVPVYGVTVDAKGAEPFSLTTADIIELILQSYGCENIKINEGSLANLRRNFPYAVGIYINQNETVNSVLTKLMAGAHGWFTFNRQGEITFGLLRSPNGFLIDTIEQNCITSLKRLNTNPASATRAVTYNRNWTVQNDGNLAGAVSGGDREFYAQPNREVLEFNNINDFINDAAINGVTDSYLLFESDAKEFANDLMNLYSVQCQSFYEIKIECGLFKYWIGDLIKVNYDRFNLQDSIFTVVSIVENSKCNDVTLKVFG